MLFCFALTRFIGNCKHVSSSSIWRHVDDIDSCGMRNLAEKIATGKLSVAAAADCASAFQKDGSTKAGAASRTV